MRKKCRANRPLHPFRFVAHGNTSPVQSHASVRSAKITPKQKSILNMISSGARILFDIKAKRAMVYSWSRGFQMLNEITVRFLASLLRSGQIVRVAQDNNLVHFVKNGVNTSWFTPDATDALAA